jgi:phosphofructokinase-like protein
MSGKKIKSIAILTGGGDCPGLNAVIRAVTKTAISKYGLTVWGIEDGYLGLIEQRLRPMHYDDVSNILTQGGTILGTSNIANPFKFQVNSAGRKAEMKDLSDACVQTLKERQIDALICIGGDGTMTSAAAFAKKGLTVIGVPKTIDNDLCGTDITFGFNTAVNTATEAIDKLHSTASSHHRVMVVEVMGRYAGWIALHSGMASGSDCILIPEIPYKLDNLCHYVLRRSQRGKRFSIIVVSEGAKELGGKLTVRKVIANSPDPIRLGGIANRLAEQLQEMTKLESRAVTLGHIQRGGSPTPFDRVLATNFGFTAIELLISGRKNCMVAVKGGDFSSVPLSQVAGKIRCVPKNHSLIKAAKAINTCFGD